jgi:hypothetical protein
MPNDFAPVQNPYRMANASAPTDSRFTLGNLKTNSPHTALMLPRFAPAISHLSNAQLAGLAPLSPDLQLFRDGDLECWYTPFEHINVAAKIVLVGITPGQTQLLNGLREVKAQLCRGSSVAEALAAAKMVGAFSGNLRQHLVALLDHAGFHTWLGLRSTLDLFGSARTLLHTTSALRHAVFYKRGNYNGTPNMLRHPLLRRHLLEHFAVEAANLQHAIFVPLGDKAAAALDFLSSEGVLLHAQIFSGLPHPSPANIERIQFFTGQKPQSALSGKTNAAKLIAARANLQERVRALSVPGAQPP